MDDKQKLIAAANRHMEDMEVKEVEMVLRFIHNLKYFR